MAAERMRSPLGRALGLGSAKRGVEHWWMQRVTAVALIPLTLWFVIALLQLMGGDLSSVHHWLGRPVPAILMVLFLIAIFYHAALGLEVVIEDYVAAELSRLGLVVLVRLVAVALAVAGIFAVLRMALSA
jgi:succinate dehydrogenase / fumarate reductase, membrane anchor subunit